MVVATSSGHLGEGAVVVVPAELPGPPAIVLPAWHTGVGSGHPGCLVRTVVRPLDLLSVRQASGLLLDVGEHGGQHPGTGGRADCRVLGLGPQEVYIGIGGMLGRIYHVKLPLGE